MPETPKKKTVTKRATTKRTVKKPVVPRAKRPKKLRLTVAERRYLEYPPTRTTWECTCGMLNRGVSDKCMSCGLAKGDNPKLVWDIYVKACEKVNITLGYKWKYSEKQRSPIYQAPGEKWVRIDPPEGLVL